MRNPKYFYLTEADSLSSISLAVLMLSTRQAVQTTGNNLTNFVKNVKIVEFFDHIWNHHDKYIEISTNMPSIGSLICEIANKMSEM